MHIKSAPWKLGAEASGSRPLRDRSAEPAELIHIAVTSENVDVVAITQI